MGCFFTLCNFLQRAYTTEMFSWPDPFFLIINWGDDIIPQVDDITLLVKKKQTIFYFCSGVLLPFRRIVYYLCLRVISMTSYMHKMSFSDIMHG